MSTIGHIIWITLGLLTILVPYFAPSIVAWFRGRPFAAIFALNLFLGWTLVGWVAALVMALWTPSRAPNGQATA